MAAKQTVTITSDLVRAFADALEHGFTGSLEAFANSADGQTAALAAQDRRNAEMRSLRQGWARAIARDFKVNGKLTTYSRDRAIALRDFLATVNFDELTDPENATTDETDATAPESAPATA